MEYRICNIRIKGGKKRERKKAFGYYSEEEVEIWRGRWSDHLQGWAPDSTWLQSLMQKPCFSLNLRYWDFAALRFQTPVSNLSFSWG
ncbi:hypothetical protein EPI10_011302 [Gossypium australe]|uniref:Uncharacterized protein n=1 Tax=Gossypium australe TaxID=47621 RepID=A0A5B6W8A0_9ROSI|nr:hypothetical protein EPI10_011302 [Gossypium australe]